MGEELDGRGAGQTRSWADEELGGRGDEQLGGVCGFGDEQTRASWEERGRVVYRAADGRVDGMEGRGGGSSDGVISGGCYTLYKNLWVASKHFVNGMVASESSTVGGSPMLRICFSC